MRGVRPHCLALLVWVVGGVRPHCLTLLVWVVGGVKHGAFTLCVESRFICCLLFSPFTSRTEEEEGQCTGPEKGGACGEKEGLVSLKQTTLHGDCRPVLEYGLVRNSTPLAQHEHEGN